MDLSRHNGGASSPGLSHHKEGSDPEAADKGGEGGGGGGADSNEAAASESEPRSEATEGNSEKKAIAATGKLTNGVFLIDVLLLT